jgi:hypothetical protein
MQAVPYLGWIVADFPKRGPGFEIGSNYMGSVVNKKAMGQVPSKYFRFACNSFLPVTVPQSSPSIIEDTHNKPVSDRSNSELACFEVFVATMKNAVFWDVTCGS